MYYATFKDIDYNDIIAFETEQERNDWVNFQDLFSKAMGAKVDNCTFERIILETDIAEKYIDYMEHTVDNFNPRMHIYIMGL